MHIDLEGDFGQEGPAGVGGKADIGSNRAATQPDTGKSPVGPIVNETEE